MKVTPIAIAIPALFATMSLATLTHHQVDGKHSASPNQFAYKRPVVIWIPPYAVAKSRQTLESVNGLDSISHLDLQFWQPTREGGAALVPEPEVTDDAIKSIRDWAHRKRVRVMLCIFNGEKDWDWPLAKAAFAGHPHEFVNSLMDQVAKFGLDGVDIDLEGPGDYDGDKGPYVNFIRELQGKLGHASKQLTLDSFCYKWNAPNWNWWPDLFKAGVDGITSMGYDELGSTASDWRSYAAQEKAAGGYAAKLQIGLSGDKDHWQGSTSTDQVAWIQKDGGCGAAIWDAQLKGKSWHAKDNWTLLQQIKTGQ